MHIRHIPIVRNWNSIKVTNWSKYFFDNFRNGICFNIICTLNTPVSWCNHTFNLISYWRSFSWLQPYFNIIKYLKWIININSDKSHFWYSDVNIYFRYWTMYSTTGSASGVMFDCLISVSLHLSSYRVIVIIWALGLSLAIPPLVGWSHYSPEPNGLR